jgi:hypothetical protein
MTQDWVLTLLAMSPLFLAGGIVTLALLPKPAQNERVRGTAEARAYEGADRMEDAKRTPSGSFATTKTGMAPARGTHLRGTQG